METGDKNRDDFHCMEMSLVMSMWFILGNDWNNTQCLSRLNAFYWAACAPSHKMGFRSSAAKNGLPGEGRHEGLVPRNDVLTNGFI